MAVVVESFTITSNTSAVVSWSGLEEMHHNAETISYTLIIENRNTSNTTSLNTSTTTASITGLIPFTSYSIKVAAINVAGRGPFSGEHSNTTFEGGEYKPGHASPHNGYGRQWYSESKLEAIHKNSTMHIANSYDRTSEMSVNFQILF